MKTEKIEVEQALEVRQMAAEAEEEGYATREEIRKGLFGFMHAITQHMHFPGACGHTWRMLLRAGP